MDANNVYEEQIRPNMNVYEQINRQNIEVVEYDSLKTTQIEEKNTRSKTTVIPHRVLVCGVIVNMVILVSFLAAATIVMVELSNQVSSLSQRLDESDVTAPKGKHKDGSSKTTHQVAFTALNANGSDPMIFRTSIYNVGRGYDNTSGKFTCPVPGVYFFAFTMSKQFGVDIDLLICHISVNDLTIIGTLQDPYESRSDNNGYSMSLSGTFHLKADDLVYVECNKDASALMRSMCSFTGFLVTPDD